MQKSHTVLVALLTSTMTFTSVPGLAAGDTARTNANGTTNTANTAGTTTNRNTANQGVMQNDAYVTISGTVASIEEDDEFVLNHKGGQIEVDTNDAWRNLFKRDAANAAKALTVGDRVTVTGRIDDDWFGDRELDAYSLRHERGGQVFNYEPTKRVEGAPDMNMAETQDDRVTLTGTITEVVNNNRYRMRFSSQSAATNTQQAATIEIDTTGITGGKDQRFNVGDRVTVVGELDDTFFRGREINVDTIRYAGQGTEQSGAAVNGSRMNEASPSSGQNTMNR